MTSAVRPESGRVVLEGGKHFYSGSIILKENVDLHLERGAVLQAHKALSVTSIPTPDKETTAWNGWELR
ncbi:MAG: hypothetical protein ACLR0U_05975 [Enterocloster clostridioformis]